MRVDVVTTVTPTDTAGVWSVYDEVFADASYGDWLESPTATPVTTADAED